MNPIIGIDFDNTIVDYDDILREIVLERGLVSRDDAASKKEIRDCLRRIPDGDKEWQRLQAEIYGPRMGEARMFDGVMEFFETCGKRGLGIFIVSHKSRYSNLGESRVDLRKAALDWMNSNGLFTDRRFAFSPDRVFFETTRAEKAFRIGSLGCDYFIDDLEELFLEERFPAKTEQLLFDPHNLHVALAEKTKAGSWKEIHERFFGFR